MRSFAGLVAGVALLAPIAPLSAACCPPGFCATYDVNNIGARLDGPSESKNETKEESIERRLAAPVTVSFDEVPLRKVIDDVHKLAPDVNVVPDLRALQEAGVSLDSPVTIKLKQVPLKTALNAILHQVHLVYVVKDEVVFVTTQEVGKGKRVTVTYPVADLVVPVGPEISGEVQPEIPGEVTRITKEAALIKTITNSIDPRSWSEVGGTGTIDYFPLTMALVVNQTPDVQEQIQDLLATLRRMQDVNVTTELRFVTVSDEDFKKLGIDTQQSGPTPAVHVLDETQVFMLLEAVQAAPSSLLTQAPRLTCFSGQKATVELMDRQAFVTGIKRETTPDGRTAFVPKTTTVSTGFQATIQPAASADLTQVTMNVGLCISRMDSNKVPQQPFCTVQPDAPTNDDKPVAFTQLIQQPRVSTFQAETTIKIPSGKTALLSGWTHQREVHNDPMPTIAAVPYVGQLFATMKPTKQKDHLLVLVTPRIVVTEEKEEKKSDVSAEQEESKPAEVLPAPESEEKTEASGKTSKDGAANTTWFGHLTSTAGPVQKDFAPVYTNARTFSLAYDVGNVGPSKLAGIDVYFTHDDGQWEHYPYPVRPTGTVPMTVAKDGRYGFTLVARSNAGLALPAPRASCAPHLSVEVDTTAPEVRLDPPKVHYESYGVVNVRWKATDHNLADAPASLEWSASPAGPWTMIAKDLPGAGSFHWKPKDVPGKVYLRLSACDRAGNVGVQVTPEPVTTDVKVPEVLGVRLSGVR